MSLIKYRYGNDVGVQALTLPLLTTASGEKMGKTVSGPLWLDPNKTSPFEFYQYLEKTPDSTLRKLFLLFTFLSTSEIDEILKGNPREAQKRLAFEVTKIVHGEEEADRASKQSTIVFSGSKENLGAIPEFKLEKSMRLDEVLVLSKSLPSNSEVTRRVKSGGIKINEKLVEDPKQTIEGECMIKFGKSNFLKVVKG